jgi:hypothetical protein
MPTTFRPTQINFSGSGRTAANSTAALGRAGSIFAGLSRQIQNDEDLANKKNKNLSDAIFRERQQEFVEGAGERKVAADEVERERVKQERIATNQISADAVQTAKDNFVFQSADAVTSDPRFKNILSGTQEFVDRPDGVQEFTPERRSALAEQGNILNDIIQANINDLSLSSDPTAIARQVREDGNAQGLDPTEIERQVGIALSDFQVTSGETAKLQLDANKAELDLAGKIFGGSGKNRSNTAASRVSQGGKTDANAISNDEFTDKYLESLDADRKDGLFQNTINFFGADTNVTRNNIKPILGVFEENGVRAVTALGILESGGIITNDEYEGVTPNELIEDAKLGPNGTGQLQELIEAGLRRQAANSSNPKTGGGGRSNAESSQLVAALTDRFRNENNRIIANTTPRQRTLAERRKTSLEFLKVETPNFVAPTPADSTETSNALINTDAEETTAPGPVASEETADTPVFAASRPEPDGEAETLVDQINASQPEPTPAKPAVRAKRKIAFDEVGPIQQSLYLASLRSEIRTSSGKEKADLEAELKLLTGKK